jgi:aldehyde dehydrogenase (NAD(P)+)
VVVQVFPADGYDRLLFSGFRAEVWMERGVTADRLADAMAGFYRRRDPRGKVALVLGAGNIASIAPLDAIHKLYAEGQVVLLKMNTVNDYLQPFLEEVFRDHVERGYLRFARGGAEVGARLSAHPLVDEIHLTGSGRTFDAIRWGMGTEGAERKRRGEPLNRRRITAELGGVGPTLVVPGPWTDADLRYQAELVLTQKAHNAGFNCVAAQVLVLPARWSRKEAFLSALEEAFRSAPPRHPYYPGAVERAAHAVAAHGRTVVEGPPGSPTLLREVDPSDREAHAFREEYFGGVLAHTELRGDSPAAFLAEAVRFSNEVLHGTLAANVLVDPATARELGPRLEDAVGALRYGTVAVNAWTGVIFGIPQATWGAFPGHTDADIQSGTGAVNNVLLFDLPERTVAYAPFRPFPRAWLSREFHVAPRPPWFVTHRRGLEVARRLTLLSLRPGLRHLPGIVSDAMRG